MSQLLFPPHDLWPDLKAAAIRYAEIWHPRDATCHVGSRELRERGLISTEAWLRVPAHDSIKVTVGPDGVREAHIEPAWQLGATTTSQALAARRNERLARVARACVLACAAVALIAMGLAGLTA